MRGLILTATWVAAFVTASPALAQTPGADPNSASPFGYPVDDRRLFVHGLLDEFEGRLGADQSFRWEGEGWVGGDFDRLWLKSEGEVTRGKVEDGQQELFYDRPVTTYFDLQAGARYDLDSRPGRGWGAFGIEGFAPYFFTVSATGYASDTGHYAAKLQASNEIRFTQRLVLEPQAELNLYTRSDSARRTGSGLSDLDAGLRLRYEISRKFAPYVGLTYEKRFARSADFARADNERPDDLRFTAGVRSWF
ncbi:copper resistance protein B [Caulobacter sp. S45]|uniref:copper resistance protein B n=1 Tax=Caulobacter sp. S45 TaxID=1641861 RepID=UPI00131AB2C4|nr:copper resistance protein B [Caulobacter sp. S45]